MIKNCDHTFVSPGISWGQTYAILINGFSFSHSRSNYLIKNPSGQKKCLINYIFIIIGYIFHILVFSIQDRELSMIYNAYVLSGSKNSLNNSFSKYFVLLEAYSRGDFDAWNSKKRRHVFSCHIFHGPVEHFFPFILP